MLLKFSGRGILVNEFHRGSVSFTLSPTQVYNNNDTNNHNGGGGDDDDDSAG